jgi:hypothetical protein
MSNWLRDHKISACIGAVALVSLLPLITANPQSVTVSPKLNYTVVCVSHTSPAVCSSDAAGFVALPSTGTTLNVNTTAVPPSAARRAPPQQQWLFNSNFPMFRR